ncbi:MAG: acetate--CoA ligase family protein [Micromonosporaceae bacterium]
MDAEPTAPGASANTQPAVPTRLLARLLAPRAVAVVGATEKPGYASRLFRNLVAGGYSGAIHPVSRTRDQVFGRPAVPAVTDLPGPVDVAIVVVPADDVPGVVEQCGQAGIGAAVVISAGFGEAGPAGRRRRDLLRDAAKRGNVLVIGPNANGYASLVHPPGGLTRCRHAVRHGVSTTPQPTKCQECDQPGGRADNGPVWATTFSGLRPEAAKPALPAVLLSQSGGAAFGAVHERAQDHGFSFQAVLSTGNEEAVSSEQLAERLLDSGTRVVALVSEDFRDGPGLLRAAAAARARGGWLVVLKVGRSAAGRAAAATHTAALASDDAVVDGVLRQHGIVRADDVDDLVQCVRFLATSRPPTGRAAVVLSHSGGLATLAADALGGAGFELPPLPEPVREQLRQVLPGTPGDANPVDISMSLREPVVTDVARALLAGGPDVLLVTTAGDAVLPERLAAARDRAGENAPPVCLVWTGGVRTGAQMQRLDAGQTPWFTGSRIAATVLSRCRDAAATRVPELPSDWRPRRRRLPAVAVDEAVGKRLLRGIGIASPQGALADTVAGVASAAAEIPPPWALKVACPSVLHKAAAGLVVLGLRDAASLREAAETLAPRARAAAQGEQWRFLLEHQHKIQAEWYVGCALDPHFGPVVGVGRGGADVEQQPIVWSTAPLSEHGARQVLADPRAAGFLGARGVSDRSLGRVAAAVAALSRWFTQAPEQPQEIEVNPLAVDQDSGDVVALDVVAHLAGPADDRGDAGASGDAGKRRTG